MCPATARWPRIDSSEMDRVVGRAALIDLAEGTLLSTSVVADVPAVDTGDGVVGLSLDPGAYPSRGLAPGDRVHVVRTEDVANLNASRRSSLAPPRCSTSRTCRVIRSWSRS